MKITIAFPTFNRAQYLRRAVRSIAMQIGTLTENVEVVLKIYDNQSSDETRLVRESLVAEFPTITVVVHAENIGGDANILAALVNAEGDYVWVFGDDDYLRENSLRRITQLLGSGGFDVLKLEASEERDARRGAGQPVPEPLGACEAGDAVETFSGADAILARFGLGMGNFSSIIFSTVFFRAHYEKAAAALFFSGYSQLVWIYRGLFKNPERFAYLTPALLVLRIELSPRHVSADRVLGGLDLLQACLVDIGYAAAVVDQFRTRQRDAIFLGQVKTLKMLEQWSVGEWLRSFRGVSSLSSRVKLIIFAILPARLYRKLWIRL